MSGFAKLHSSISTSSLLALPVASRWVWTFLMSQANAAGIVEGAVPGLAIAANVTLEECVVALDAFLAPDPYSRTKDHEGRRLVEIDGGWRIVNYEKYRRKLSADDRLESKRKAEQARRDRQRASTAETAGAVRRLRGKPVNGSEQARNA